MASLRFFNSSRAQGCRIGLLRSAMGNVGCLPVRRKSSLVTRGWAGSSVMGPAPRGGGMNCPPSAIHPTLLLGENSGTAAAAPEADQNVAAQAQRRPVKTPPTRPRIGFGASLDMLRLPDAFGAANRFVADTNPVLVEDLNRSLELRRRRRAQGGIRLDDVEALLVRHQNFREDAALVRRFDGHAPTR